MSAGPTWPLLAIVGRVWLRFFVRAGKNRNPEGVKEPIRCFSHREKFRMFSGEEHSTGNAPGARARGTAARPTRIYLLNTRDAIKQEQMIAPKIFVLCATTRKLAQGRSREHRRRVSIVRTDPFSFLYDRIGADDEHIATVDAALTVPQIACEKHQTAP